MAIIIRQLDSGNSHHRQDRKTLGVHTGSDDPLGGGEALLGEGVEERTSHAGEPGGGDDRIPVLADLVVHLGQNTALGTDLGAGGLGGFLVQVAKKLAVFVLDSGVVSEQDRRCSGT